MNKIFCCRFSSSAAPASGHLRHFGRPRRLDRVHERVHHHRRALLLIRRRQEQGQEDIQGIYHSNYHLKTFLNESMNLNTKILCFLTTNLSVFKHYEQVSFSKNIFGILTTKIMLVTFEKYSSTISNVMEIDCQNNFALKNNTN